MSDEGRRWNRWWVVVACVLGLIVGTGSINVFAFGVFLKPVTEDLGVSRAVLSSGLALSSLLTAIGCPIVGLMIDRWGTRAVMLPAVTLFAVATATFAFLRGSSLALIYLLFAFSGIFGGGQTPIAYAKIIAAWFDRERGLALGIAMAGVGLGTALIPQLAAFLIAHVGWRMAYVGLGVAIFVLAFVPIAVFARDPPALARRSHSAAPALPGVTLGAALRTWRFWALTLAFFLAVAAINGTLTHVVALLTDRGLPIQMATGALSAAGLAIILGRILSGYCLDRFFGSHVAIGFFLVPIVGIALLGSGAGGLVPLAGAVLCGVGIGAEVDLMAFFVSRYFGLAAFGKIYGTMFAVFAVGTGLGPYFMDLSYGAFHSYRPMFAVFAVALVATCALFRGLGPYPFPPQPRIVPSGAEVSLSA